jgi:hypothetical protein
MSAFCQVEGLKPRALPTVALERTFTVNSDSLPETTSNAVDVQGGEPLAGSGFEAEEPDDGFSPDASEAEVA